MVKQNSTKIYEWKCEKCNKVIASLSKNQFEFNKKLHLESCKNKEKLNEDIKKK